MTQATETETETPETETPTETTPAPLTVRGEAFSLEEQYFIYGVLFEAQVGGKDIARMNGVLRKIERNADRAEKMARKSPE